MSKIKQTNSNTKEQELLPLSSDYVFKRIFGKEGNEKILKSLLEAILKIHIEKIEIKNPEIPKETIKEKLSVLDIKAVINKNTIIDIEMQVGNKEGLKKRLVVYGSKLIAGDLKISENYIKVRDTIVICIVNEDITKRNSYLSIAKLKYEKTEEKRYVEMGYKKEDEVLTEMIKYYIIEIEKFKKKKPKLGDMLEKWLYVIGGDEKMMEECKKENGEIKEAVEQLEKMSADERERQIYEEREKAIISYQIDKGEAVRAGEERGRKEGISIGEKKEKIEIAKKMLDNNFTIEQIEIATGLTPKEIEKIKSK